MYYSSYCLFCSFVLDFPLEYAYLGYIKALYVHLYFSFSISLPLVLRIFHFPLIWNEMLLFSWCEKVLWLYSDECLTRTSTCNMDFTFYSIAYIICHKSFIVSNKNNKKPSTNIRTLSKYPTSESEMSKV